MLPDAVVAALADPPDAERGHVAANGLSYATRSWGDPAAPPVLLIHGVTSTSRIWWRMGPAVAAGLGRRVVAVDQAGHGETSGWLGHHRIRDNADDLVRFVEAAGLRRPDLRVVGHSWGGMTAAWFPALGLETEALVLLDPPALPLPAIARLLDDPIERHYDDLGEALATLAPLNPTWAGGDLFAKAESLTLFDEAAVRDVLLENGDWDGGLAALAEPAARGARPRWIRGDPAFGGLIPDPMAAEMQRRFGPDAVITMTGATHSPMRIRPTETAEALLAALTPA